MRHLQVFFKGGIHVFLSEALVLPTGLLTAAFLSRKLGPDGYGLLILAATMVSWVEWSVTSLFSRTSFKFIGEREDWQPVASVILRLHLYFSIGAAIIFWLLAAPLATLMNEPVLAKYLNIFAWEIPFFCLAKGYRNILVGIGRFSQRALGSAVFWIARLIFIVILVELGLSVTGAILGIMCATLLEFLLTRHLLGLKLFLPSDFRAKNLWHYSIPLFLSATSRRIYQRLDLFALKSLGATAAQAGFYGAAQNLLFISGIFLMSFAPLLLSTLSKLLSGGNEANAKKLARNAIRLVIGLLPLCGLFAGSVTKIVALIYGKQFAPSSPLFTILVFGEIGAILISVTTAILTALGRPRWTFILNGALVVAAMIGYWLVIPRFGSIGAALVTSIFSMLGGIGGIFLVYFRWKILPSIKTILRSCLICAGIYAAAIYWPATGIWLFVKLSLLTLAIPVVFLMLGEFDALELRKARQYLSSTKNF